MSMISLNLVYMFMVNLVYLKNEIVNFILSFVVYISEWIDMQLSIEIFTVSRVFLCLFQKEGFFLLCDEVKTFLETND